MPDGKREEVSTAARRLAASRDTMRASRCLWSHDYETRYLSRAFTLVLARLRGRASGCSPAANCATSVDRNAPLEGPASLRSPSAGAGAGEDGKSWHARGAGAS